MVRALGLSRTPGLTPMSPRKLQPVHQFCVAVALLGLAALGVILGVSPLDVHRFGSLEFLALALSVMLGELFPLELPRRTGDGEVTTSTMFTFALVLGVGLVPALAAQLTASVAQDRLAGKPWWQVGFNVGQYTLSVTAAAAVQWLIAGHGVLERGTLVPMDLIAVVAAAAAFFIVNLLLVTRATTLYEGTPFRQALMTDLPFGLSV